MHISYAMRSHSPELFNPFPHTTNLQQTTLSTSFQNNKISLYEGLLTKVKNIVAKGKIACFEQFVLLS